MAKKRTYFVVFKAGYEVEAKDRDEAVREALKELAEEIIESGLSKFCVDVDGEPYVITVG